ncbi:heavy metal translocating P-type ATPase [Bacillus sp. B-jedd]|uniref:heavy metal translocating P-type ATPase n=1 Tax=Bacillus sp. B-jedd TaxID=1476857 RepID=UPI0005155E9D|nr:cation-translocating P-type ATPase [Bacillus sp. B-jedd]CEG28872.1 heavy metal translocating P-type ATPase [Bacillus sp. B-jedd]
MVARYKTRLMAVAFVLIVAGFSAGWLGVSGVKTAALAVATVLAGAPIFAKAVQSVRMRVFSIDVLVTIAVAGAVYLGEFTESSVVTFLFLFGDFLEARTLEKTRSSIKKLVDMTPQEATVIRDGGEQTVPVEEVVIGDRVIIRPGGKIPVDGTVVSGRAHLNEAVVTGEAVPVGKTSGDKVFSGTIVDNGYIEIVAEKVGDDTTFAKIIELVEEAQESKSKAEKFLDSFSAFYTPAVLVLAVLVYVVTTDLKLAITFLVIACPGALVIGAPVSSVAGIGNGAKHGVLIKGGEIMEMLSKVDTIVFDKTGTLTKGKPEVTDVKIFAKMDTEGLLRLVAAVEMMSEHHLGRAIVSDAEARGLDFVLPIEDGEVVKGHGIRAVVDGARIVVGNRALMELEGVSLTRAADDYAVGRERAGNTAVFAAVEGEIAGIISIADQIRDDAPEALVELRRNGIRQIIMLTGDNRHTAQLVAARLGVDEFVAEMLPEEKAAFVKRLKAEGRVVAMAGDGINDAPAIATADIGLAMGEGGTDISMETAGVVLMADRLGQLSHAYSLAKATIRNMKQNTWFAIGTAAVLLIGVLYGAVHLASGMFIHEASVVLVILNAMRLTRFGPRVGSDFGKKKGKTRAGGAEIVSR